jgi:hypothetical protein
VGNEDSLLAGTGYHPDQLISSLLVAVGDDDPCPGLGETPGYLPAKKGSALV